MDLQQPVTFILIPKEDFELFKETAQKILKEIEGMKARTVPPARVAPPIAVPEYITAEEFMNAVGIKRTKFDKLVATNKIKTLKKARRIKVPFSEVRRYFEDPSIQ